MYRRARWRFACYSDRVGRLENIIARNQRPRGSRERTAVSIGFGVAILVILALMVFTDLGTPPVPSSAAPRPAVTPSAGSDHRGQRVDGVLLRRQAPSARPAQR
jgi:hypothetical protein